jgi:hypothetical protein
MILFIAAAAIEYGTWKVTGSTLSQHLWRLHRRKPYTRWITLSIFVVLTSHLVWGWP